MSNKTKKCVCGHLYYEHYYGYSCLQCDTCHKFTKLDTDVSNKTEDAVNHPPHYKNHPSGVECIEITRHMNFNLGNAVKYIWRAGLKGDALEDLKKAEFYIKDEIARIEVSQEN